MLQAAGDNGALQIPSRENAAQRAVSGEHHDPELDAGSRSEWPGMFLIMSKQPRPIKLGVFIIDA